MRRTSLPAILTGLALALLLTGGSEPGTWVTVGFIAFALLAPVALGPP